jgi:tetratricopeptide (TPR) repeat protein
LGNPPDVRFALAQAHQTNDDDVKALQALSGEPPPDPLRAPWLFTRGFSLFRMGRYDAAESTFRSLLKYAEMQAPAQFFLANCAYARGMFAESLPLYDKAIAAGDSPSNRALNAYYHNRGLALYELRRFEEAAGSFRQSIERYPRDAMPYLLLARCLTELDRHKEAMESLEKAIQLEPGFRLAYYQLARLHQQYGDKQRGRELFQKVSELRGQELAKEEDMARRLKVGR